jgi:hypothetical protein
VISEPTRTSQWTNGVANPVAWRKGVLDGIASFDVEMARLSQDGLTFVARNGEQLYLPCTDPPPRPCVLPSRLTRTHTVPATSTSLNILLQDVPPGDDYFLIFINSTHGVMHATSPRFAVLPASSPAKSSQPSPISGATTVTVSGAPNPTRPFATTFPALANGVLPSLGNVGQAWGLASMMAGCLAGAAWTLW